MKIKTINIAELHLSEYNPRKDLQPEDAEYQKLKRSIEEFGYVEPIIWNEITGNIVDGHQRFKVLRDIGMTEIECVVIQLEEKDEKILNVLLNKAKGRWDTDKLTNILQELADTDAIDLTGFEDWELQSFLMQYDHIKDLMNEDFSGYAFGEENETFVMTFTLPGNMRDIVEQYMQETHNAKEELAAAVIKKVKGLL